MRKSLFIFGCLFCILPLWATQIYLPTYQNVVELHSGDTVRLDTAGTYRFFQTVDTLHDVLILSEVNVLPSDTSCQRIIIQDLNIKNHNTEVRTSGVCCIRLEDYLGVETLLYAEGTNILCPGLSYGYHHPSAIGCGIRVNTPIPTTITGPGTLVYAPETEGFYEADVSGCLIGICDDSGKCTISVDSIASNYAGTTYKYDIHWGANTQLMIRCSQYGANIKYGARYSKGSRISVDADSCASITSTSSDSLFVYRGNINKITDFAYAEIGVDRNPNIHINSIGASNSPAPTYTKVYSGNVDYYDAGAKGVSYKRLDLLGGTISKAYISSWTKQASDTIFYMKDYNNPKILNLRLLTSKGCTVIDGGIVESTEDLRPTIRNYGLEAEVYHVGNVYWNHGIIRTSKSNVPIFLESPEQDTLFIGELGITKLNKLVDSSGNDSIIMSYDTLYGKSIINHSVGMYLQSNFDGYGLKIASSTRGKYIPLLKASNSTTGDSLYIIDSQGEQELTLPDLVYSSAYDIWDIYPAYTRTIHYQVGDGIAPRDSSYQEGLVRYFTTVPTRTDYDFAGWYADSTYTTRVDSLDEWSRGDTTLWAKWEHSREIPSLSIMIAQGSCLAVRNPEGLSELDSAYYTWVHLDTIRINGVDSIISDTLPSHKMYVEVGDPIPQGWYTAIIHIEEGWTVYVSRYIPATVLPTSSPRNSNKRTLFYIGSYIFGIDDEGKKYLIMP